MIPAAYSGIYPRHTPPPAERLAILPPEPPAAPTLPPPPVDADCLAARAAHRAADCLDALADEREAAIEDVISRRNGLHAGRWADVTIAPGRASAVGALLGLARHTHALDADAWAAIVSTGIEGPEQDRALAETLRAWASARPTDPAPSSEARGG